MSRIALVLPSLTVVLLIGNTVQAGLIGNYNESNGELELVYDGAEGAIAGIRLNSSAAGLVAGQATDLGGTITGPLSVLNDQAPNFIEWGNLVGYTFDNVEAGAVLPSGLSQADLDAGYELLFRSLAQPTVDIVGTLNLLGGDGLFPDQVVGTEFDITGAIASASGLLEDIITFTGGGSLSDVQFSNQSIPGLFFANIDGLSVDIGVDLGIAAMVPAGTLATADLTVVGDGGPWQYAVIFFPEPSSLGLAGLASLAVALVRRCGI